MADPVSDLKKGISVSTVLTTFAALVVIFAILDLLGFGGALLSPVTFIKNKLHKGN